MIWNLFLIVGPFVVFRLLVSDSLSWRQHRADLRMDIGEPLVGRLWWEGYRDWQPHWIHYIWPERGADEFGRRTVVFPVPGFGWLVWAYRTCHCEDCDDLRAQTERFLQR